MNREAQFLVAVVRRFLHSQAVPPDLTGLDWSVATGLASAHGVTPLVYRVLRTLPMPEQVAEELRAAVEAGARASLALSAALCGLAESFEQHAIRFVPFKGPLLSQQLYGDLAFRSPGDLDLLIAPRDVLRARDVLLADGYRLESPLHWPCDSAWLKSRECEMVLAAVPRSASIDLHWRILPAYFASPFDRLDVWDSLTRTRFAGRELPCLTPEHLLPMLCAHAAKHAYARLAWICDIARCLIALPDLSWSTVLSAAARAGTTRQLLVGLRVAENLLEAPIPPTLPQDGAVEPLVQLVRARILAGRSIRTPELELIPFCLRTFESRRHRVRYLLGHLAPSWAEYRALTLPPSLYWFYYLFRPLRLMTRTRLRRTQLVA